jgi:hypothetical protein
VEERGGDALLRHSITNPFNMLAGRISVQAINEKAPTIDHVGPWFVLQLMGLLSLRLPKPQTKPQTIEG